MIGGIIWMNREELIRSAESFTRNSELNCISKDAAISDDVAGMRIYDDPIFAFGSADDKLFEDLKKPSAIGEHFMLPKEWLPGARTVVSFFLPFSEAVKKGNGRDMSWPSSEWLHGRIEGQSMLIRLCAHLNSALADAGYGSIVPAMDERFWSNTDSTKRKEKFTSNWSERHAAFVCGLGTFGLSKGLITEKGIAGRFGSIVTELEIEPDVRDYDGIYEYCSMCGKCAKNCPAGAISIENGKNHQLCSRFLDITSEKYKPRYGCGKCQVRVPCESGIPKHGKAK
jgi:epoxyqueuosine reductase